MFNELVKNHNVQKSDKLIAFLASLCLFLSAIEYIIPKPLPFMRLGLANMPIIIALYLLKPKQVFFLVFLKVLGQGFISGTLFSYIFLFSLSGSFASCFVMLISKTIGKKYIGPIGVSILGSLANAGIQLVMADLLLFGDATRYIAPILTVNASLTGFLLGLFTSHFLQKSLWFSQLVDCNTKDCSNA